MKKSVGEVKFDILTGKVRGVPNNGGLKRSLLSTYREDLEKLRAEVSSWRMRHEIALEELEATQDELEKQRALSIQKPGFLSRIISFAKRVKD